MFGSVRSKFLSMLGSNNNVSFDAVERELEDIRHMTNPAWATAYRHMRQEQAWRGRPVFLCGGGAQLPGVRGVFRDSWVQQFGHHDLRELARPRDFDADRSVPFGRLAVAYGLSIPKPELGKYLLPKDSPDHTPRKTYKVKPDQEGPTWEWLGG
jgi:hypothetical protein